MQESQDYLNGLRKKQPRKGKARPNHREAACLLLGNKLYYDYANAYGKSRGVEVEHFAEDWIRKCIQDNDRIMARSIWKHFLCRLVERKNSRK